MTGLWALAQIAGAEVTIQDPAGCLDLSLLDAELEDRGLPPGAEMEVSIVADGDAREVALTVHREGEVLWDRALSITAADCGEQLPVVVALTLERGLAALPRSDWEGQGARGVWLGLGAGGSLGVSGVSGPRLHMDLRAEVGGKLRWLGALRTEQGLWQEVGHGEGRIGAWLAGTGLTLALPVGPLELRPTVAGYGGAARVAGRGFDHDEAVTVPRLLALGAAGVGAGPGTLALEAELPVTRLTLQGDGATTQEAPARLRLAVGVAIPL